MCMSKDYAHMKHYFKTDYLAGISDYKQALKAEIEKEIKLNAAYDDPIDCGVESGLKTALKLIDSVLPLK